MAFNNFSSVIFVSFCVLFVASVLKNPFKDMKDLVDAEIVEFIEQQVYPGDVPKFLALDKEIWTSFLSEQPGFINKYDLIPHNQTIANTFVYQLIQFF